MTDEIYVKVVDLPGKVHGFTHVEPDGSYTIIVNANDCEARRMKAYRHEVDHIKRGDFDFGRDVQAVEMEAHQLVPTPDRMPSPAFEAMMAALDKRRKEAARKARLRRKWEAMMGFSDEERFALYENKRLEE